MLKKVLIGALVGFFATLSANATELVAEFEFQSELAYEVTQPLLPDFEEVDVAVSRDELQLIQSERRFSNVSLEREEPYYIYFSLRNEDAAAPFEVGWLFHI